MRASGTSTPAIRTAAFMHSASVGKCIGMRTIAGVMAESALA